MSVEANKMIESGGVTPVEDVKGKKKNKFDSKDLVDDWQNILILIFLYFLQGVPFGLVWSVPLLLGSRKISYSDQGTFSFASWPMAFKILWAPLVDAFYIRRVGRRRTWVIFCLLTSGLLMLGLSSYVNDLLDAKRERKPEDIYILTLIFGTFVFLSSTQDIALDGWSLELLLSKNTMWQPLCNGVGMGAGGFVGNAVFLTLESEEFSNNFVRPFFRLPKKPGGVLSVKMYMLFFGTFMLVTSILVFLFKNERNLKKMAIESERVQMEELDQHIESNTIFNAYKGILRLFKIVPMRKLILVLITIRIGLSTESVIRLKLIDQGVSKEKISLLGVALSPLLFLLPIFLSKLVQGPEPLRFFFKVYPYKMLMVLAYTLFVYFVPYFATSDGGYTVAFYLLYFALNLLNAIVSYMFFVCVGSFVARISDKSIGGTYMTFLGLWLSVGRAISSTSTLYIIGLASIKNCIHSDSGNSTTIATTIVKPTKCSFNSDAVKCQKSGGQCETVFDSFYLLSVVYVFLGLVWIMIFTGMLKRLQALPLSEWLVIKSKPRNDTDQSDKLAEEKVKLASSMEMLK